MDILRQDRREAAEQRRELCNFIAKLQGEIQSTEEHRDKVNIFSPKFLNERDHSIRVINRGLTRELHLQLQSQCEQLQLKVRTLHLDWETEQKRNSSYFNQIMELEKERDQVSVYSGSPNTSPGTAF